MLSSDEFPPGRATVLMRQLYSWLMVNFGRLFTAASMCALLAFPLLKGNAAGYVPVFLGIGIGAALLLPAIRHRLSALIERPTPRGFIWSVMLLAICLRLVAVFAFPKEPMVDDAQFHRYAANMAIGEEYGTPAYRAFFPPGMSLLLTPPYVAFGSDPYVGKILNAAFGSASVFALYHIGLLIGSPLFARWASIVAAVFPTSVFYCATLGYEVVLGLVFELIYLLLLIDIVDSGGRPMRLSFMGLLTGFGCLLKPVCLLIPGILSICWWVATGKLTAALRGIWIALVMAIVVAPWTYRNYQVFGDFVLISTNGGVVLYAANNPEATGIAMNVRPAVGEVSEVDRDKICGDKAVKWILANPLRSLDLMWRKVTYTWGTSSSIMSVVSTDRLNRTIEAACMALLNVAWAALLTVCAVASWKSDVWSISKFAFPCVLLGYFFGLHLFYEALSRHHLPVIFCLILIAVSFLSKSTELPVHTESVVGGDLRSAKAVHIG